MQVEHANTLVDCPVPPSLAWIQRPLFPTSQWLTLRLPLQKLQGPTSPREHLSIAANLGLPSVWHLVHNKFEAFKPFAVDKSSTLWKDLFSKLPAATLPVATSFSTILIGVPAKCWGATRPAFAKTSTSFSTNSSTKESEETYRHKNQAVLLSQMTTMGAWRAWPDGFHKPHTQDLTVPNCDPHTNIWAHVKCATSIKLHSGTLTFHFVR